MKNMAGLGREAPLRSRGGAAQEEAAGRSAGALGAVGGALGVRKSRIWLAKYGKMMKKTGKYS